MLEVRESTMWILGKPREATWSCGGAQPSGWKNINFILMLQLVKRFGSCLPWANTFWTKPLIRWIWSLSLPLVLPALHCDLLSLLYRIHRWPAIYTLSKNLTRSQLSDNQAVPVYPSFIRVPNFKGIRWVRNAGRKPWRPMPGEENDEPPKGVMTITIPEF